MVAFSQCVGLISMAPHKRATLDFYNPGTNSHNGPAWAPKDGASPGTSLPIRASYSPGAKEDVAPLSSTTPIRSVSGLGNAFSTTAPPTAGVDTSTPLNISSKRVNLLDFLSDSKRSQALDGKTYPDVTAELELAQNAGGEIFIPACHITLNDFRPATGKLFHGAGYKVSIIKQGDAAKPAFNCRSDATTGQIVGTKLLNVGFLGKGEVGAVAVVTVSATSPYVINKCEFDFIATDTNTALELICPNGEIYENIFKIKSFNSNNTAIKSSGVYNTYDFIAEHCKNGIAIDDRSKSSVFERCVTDGQQIYSGQNCTILSPTVETIYGEAVYSAMQFIGYNHVAINPTISNVNNSKVKSGFSFTIYNQHTLIHPRVLGTVNPNYPFDINTAGSASTIIGGPVQCTFKLESYLSAENLTRLTLLGDCSTFSSRPKSGISSAINVQYGPIYTLDASKATKGLDSTLVFEGPTPITLTLPTTSSHYGRIVRILTRTAHAVTSASPNIIPINSKTPGTSILTATAGKWALLQFDGTYWNVIESN